MIDTSLALCSRCGTKLKTGGFTYCPACGYENYYWLARKKELETFEYEERLKKEAKKAGFNSIEEHDIWKTKISVVEKLKISKIRSFEKIFYSVALPIISLIISLLVISTWWLIFKLIFAMLIYFVLKFIVEDLFDVFDTLSNNTKNKYREMAYDSTLFKDNNKLKNTIIRENKDELITTKFNKKDPFYELEDKNKSTENITRINAKVVRNNDLYNIEFDSKINQVQIEQIRTFTKSLPKGNSKKIAINGEGNNIRNLDTNEIRLIIGYLETISIYIKNKKIII